MNASGLPEKAGRFLFLSGLSVQSVTADCALFAHDALGCWPPILWRFEWDRFVKSLVFWDSNSNILRVVRGLLSKPLIQ